MRTKLMWTLGSAVVLAASIAVLRTDPSKKPNGPSVADEQAAPSGEPAQASGEGGADEYRALRNRVSALSAALEELKGRDELAASEQSPEEATSIAPPETPEELVEAARAWADGYSAQLESALSTQAGGAWSQQAEAEAREALQYLGGAEATVRVTCKATLCRGEITHQAAGGHSDLLLRAYERVGWDGPTFMLPLQDEGLERTVIYLAKPGTELPIPESGV